MQAKETKLQDIIEGTKQYVIPLFQRTYSWTSQEWEILWKDLVELCEAEKNPGTPYWFSCLLLADYLCNLPCKLTQRIVPRTHNYNHITGLNYPCNLLNNLFSLLHADHLRATDFLCQIS